MADVFKWEEEYLAHQVSLDLSVSDMGVTAMLKRRLSSKALNIFALTLSRTVQMVSKLCSRHVHSIFSYHVSRVSSARNKSRQKASTFLHASFQNHKSHRRCLQSSMFVESAQKKATVDQGPCSKNVCLFQRNAKGILDLLNQGHCWVLHGLNLSLNSGRPSLALGLSQFLRPLNP